MQQHSSQLLREIRISGGFLDGFTFRFNGKLNCIIGARGTGKTTFIEFIRYVFDLMPPDPAARKRVEGIVAGNLSGGRIEIHVTTKNGTEYIISRTQGEQPMMLKGDGTATGMQYVPALFGIDVFSQNEVESIADNAASQLALIESFDREEFLKIADAIRATREGIRENARNIQPVQREIAGLKDAVSALPGIEEKLKSLANLAGDDSKKVTEANLELLLATPFVTRLPGVYQECDRVISEAVDAGKWVELGTLSELPSPASRPCSDYRVAESHVTLYGIKYRAVIVHSDSHDRRMQKRLEKAVNASRQNLEKQLKKQEREFFCQADAEKAAEALRKASDSMHALDVEVIQTEANKRGRPPKNGSIQTRPKYMLKTAIRKKEEGVKREEELAGCFVLLTNIPLEGDGAMDAKSLFLAYKGQYGVENNFAFLKDPLIVNDMFLKKAERIDVLGIILIISLLIWRLIERSMRNHLANTGGSLVGLNKQLTNRPTAYAMSTMFRGLQIMLVQGTRMLVRDLSDEVTAYLEALGLTIEVFTTPGYACKPVLKEQS